MTSFTDQTGGWPDGDGDTGDSGLLRPQESLDDDNLGDDLDAGYSPVERPLGSTAWGITEREAASREDLTHRLAREVSDQAYTTDTDGIGDTSDTDGEPLDDQVGDARAGRLVAWDIDSFDSGSNYWAYDIGIDGGAASAEEAAIHIIPEQDEDDR
jgi:hypothetical protein